MFWGTLTNSDVSELYRKLREIGQMPSKFGQIPSSECRDMPNWKTVTITKSTSTAVLVHNSIHVWIHRYSKKHELVQRDTQIFACTCVNILVQLETSTKQMRERGGAMMLSSPPYCPKWSDGCGSASKFTLYPNPPRRCHLPTCCNALAWRGPIRSFSLLGSHRVKDCAKPFPPGPTASRI